MIDFIRLLKDNNIEYRIDTDNYVNINCPFHDNGTRGFKGGINLAGGYYHCWVCSGAPIEKVFSELLNISFYEAKKLLLEYDTESRIIKKVSKKAKGKEIVLPGIEIAEHSNAWNYLVKRNFDPELVINTYKLKDGGLIGNYAFRIIIPIYYKNVLVSFQARSIYSKEYCDKMWILRYKNYPIELSKVNIKHILYNLDNCLEDWTVLQEGATDVWRLGPKNVCATLGTSMSEQQIILLAERFKKVIFLFDNEKEAQERAKKYGERLAGLGVEVEIFNPEFEHDPGDYNEEEELFVRKELGLL